MEWLFDKNYNSWFYLKADGTYAEKVGKPSKARITISNQAATSMETWIDRSYVTSSGAKLAKGGSLTRIITLGSISTLMEIMPIKNGSGIMVTTISNLVVIGCE